MYLTEEARKVWSKEQMMFVQALHTFATSYFAGNVKIEQSAETPAAAKPETAEAETTTFTPKKLQCPPGQKEKVAAAINNYVKSTGVAIPAPQPVAPKAEIEPPLTANPQPAPPTPMAPVAGSAN